MINPTVSVVIPNYNHALYLEQRIESVLQQSFADFEIIILDDCSTDNSREIIGRYKNHEKVSTVVYNETNSGNTFAQWDKGIQLSKGEYIWIAESDDWSEPGFLQTMIGALKENQNIVLGYCQSYCINGDNNIQFQSAHPRLADYVNGEKFISEFLLLRNPIFNAGMAVWRKEVYTKIDKTFLHYQTIGDYCFWIEICKHGDVFISGKLLNYFRTHGKNVSVNAFKNGLIFTELIRLLQSLCNNKSISVEDFTNALKINYYNFRHHRKSIPEKQVLSLEHSFAAATSITGLKIYFWMRITKEKIKQII